MKKLKIFIMWNLIPLVISCLVLFYMDNFYLSSKKTFKINKVQNTITKKKKTQKIDLIQGAKNIQVSYNGDYISYILENSIYIISSKDKSEQRLDFEDGNVNYTKWLPDRNILFIGEKISGGIRGSQLKFYSYDSDKKNKFELEDNNNNKTIINLPNNTYNISEMTLSTTTNTIYLKISSEGNRDKIYRINTMAELERKSNLPRKIGKVCVMNREDRLVYENEYTKKVCVEETRQKYFQDDGMYSLLGVTENDIAYIGHRVDGRESYEKLIDKIYYFSLTDESQNDKQEIKLINPVSVNDIEILCNGRVYIIDRKNNILTDINNNTQISYKGDLVRVYTGGFSYLEENKIVLKPIS